MFSTSLALRFALPAVLAALTLSTGCNQKKETDSDAGSVVATTQPDPAMTAAMTPPVDAGAGTTVTTPTPTPVGNTPTTAPKGSSSVVLPGASATAVSSSSATASPASSAMGKAAACLASCGAAVTACMTPTLNSAGVPVVKDPAACNAKGDECRKACQ